MSADAPPPKSGPPKSGASDREARLAQALRDNLRRRKAAPSPPSSAPVPDPEPEPGS